MAQGILKYCLRGCLGKKQREALFSYLDATSNILSEKQDVDEITATISKMNEALALLERDFPITVQVSIQLNLTQSISS